MYKNVDDLIEDIKQQGEIASEGDLLYDDNNVILSHLNKNLLDIIYPFYIGLDQTYYLTQEIFTTDGDGYINIPVRVYQRQLYELTIPYGSHYEENVKQVTSNVINSGTNQSSFYQFYFLGNRLRVLCGNYPLINKEVKLYYNKAINPLSFDYNNQTEGTTTIEDVIWYNIDGDITSGKYLLQNKFDVMQVVERDVEYRLNDVQHQVSFNEPLGFDDFVITKLGFVSYPELVTGGYQLLILRTLLSMTTDLDRRKIIMKDYNDMVSKTMDVLQTRITEEAIEPNFDMLF